MQARVAVTTPAALLDDLSVRNILNLYFRGEPGAHSSSLRVVRQVVAKAEGTNPWRLVQHLKEWQEGVYGWAEPDSYGEELARVVYFSDFALWIPWATRA